MLAKLWLAQHSGNLNFSCNFDLMHYSPAPIYITRVMLLLKKWLSTFQQDEQGPKVNHGLANDSNI